MCLYSTIGRNAKYEKNQKNGGIIPPINDYRTLYVARECGNCKECRAKRAREWQVRLLEDIKEHKYGKMITLTFSNQNYSRLYKLVPKTKETKKPGVYKELTPYEIDNEIATIAVKRFRERWRKQYGKTIRHWLITELGHNGTNNIHMHGILWTNEKFSTIRDKWAYGYIYPRKDEERLNYVSARTINYIVKYVHKMDMVHKTYKSIILGSPGLGKNYINEINKIKHKYQGVDTVLTYKCENGREIALPKYYIEKLFTENEKEKLWMINEDKLIRWIGKEKISIQNNMKTYFNIRDHHRKINKELGYGTNIPNVKRRKYEHEIQKIMHKARTKKHIINVMEGPTAI